MKKLFVVEKLVMASNVQEALRLERTTPPTSIYMDVDFRKTHYVLMPPPPVGFAKKTK